MGALFGFPMPLWAVKAIAFALAAVALILIGRSWGQASVYEDWLESNETAAVASARIVVTQQVVTERVITKYLKTEGETRVVTETIDREVTRYVESKPLALACLLDDRWVQLHDAAAAGAVPPAIPAAPGEMRAPPAPAKTGEDLGRRGSAYGVCELCPAPWLREPIRRLAGMGAGAVPNHER